MDCFWSTLIATLIGVFVGSFLSLIISFNILKRQTFNQAVAKFRSAFIETERVVDPRHNIKNTYVHGEFVYELVLPNIIEQEKAMIEFSHLLSNKKRISFHSVLDEIRLSKLV